MTNVLRSIVSGNKARFVDEDSNLDLSYISNNLIIMGYPASGVESLYRNPRHAVLKFLEGHHGRSWHLYNFCPLSENTYDPAEFYNQVSRFPFPDHHPPPLSLIPLFVDHITRYLAASPDNTAVIHCKAGKGRSGSMTCCYLLSLPELPAQPTLKTPAKQSSLLKHASLRTAFASRSPDRDQRFKNQQPGANGTAPGEPSPPESPPDSPQAGPSEKPTPGSSATSLSGNNIDSMQPSDLEAIGISEKLRGVFDLHTRQRMKPGSQKRGVSIPSQQRFVKYWSLMLAGKDPRSFVQSRSPRRVRIDSVKVTLQNESRLLSHQQLSARVAVYEDAYTDLIRGKEVKLREQGQDASTDGSEAITWQDAKDVICEIGSLAQTQKTDSPEEPRTLTGLTSKESGSSGAAIEVMEDRETQVKILVGRTGHKHQLLPDWASLGYIWFVPSFHAPEAGSSTSTIELSGTEDVDFHKAGLGQVVITLSWL